MMRALCTGLALLLLAPAVASAEGAAQAVIEKTVVEVLAILRDESLDASARRASLETLAQDRFDFRTMSRLVLARNWKRLSKDQQAEFVDEFETYLANDYGSRIERYDQEEVEVLGERPEPRGDVTVKTKIVGGENDGALVDYRMRSRDGAWKIIDVVIEGISLVANFRDQFRDVMGREGPVTLIEKLREKNADGTTIDPPEGA
ncbi:MAG: MlaC/ttg2D family ABC transporter substrate-binding protein [Myxococcota bacterium]